MSLSKKLQIKNVGLVLFLATSFISQQAVAESQIKSGEAIMTSIKSMAHDKLELKLDFINTFTNGKDEYKRYLKTGYPYLSYDDFETTMPGGFTYFNKNKTIRTLKTDHNTVFYINCFEHTNMNKDGLVKLNKREFFSIADTFIKKDFAEKFEDNFKDLRTENKHCANLGGDLVHFTYQGKLIKSISFILTP